VALPETGISLIVTSHCFREDAARLMQAKQEDLYGDAMIAATARVTGSPLLPGTSEIFLHLGVKIVNPFKS